MIERDIVDRSAGAFFVFCGNLELAVVIQRKVMESEMISGTRILESVF